MKTVDQQLTDFVEGQEHLELTTERGIVISAPDEHYLEAEYTFIDTEDVRFSINFWCEQKEFVQRLGITSVQDIYDLTPGSLMEMYYEGFAEMVCFVAIDYTYNMNFKKLGNRIVAENERGLKHEVPLCDKLETPDHFIAYARRYYELMECSEN